MTKIVDQQDPICAVSSPPGSGAIALIRASGEGVIALCGPMIRLPGGERLPELAANTTRYAAFYRGDEQLDEVMVTLYRAPRSYTGEDMVEVSCHGSPYIQQQILLTMIEGGIRAARPGEFTQRAFLHGKMDLAQAEGVADLIAAAGAAAHRLALSQLRGRVSRRIGKVREKLLHFASLIELELDFGEEDVEFADRSELLSLATELVTTLQELAATFREGNVMKNGIPVAIAGAPNTGKSTLLNALLQEEKAIVSEIPGTTRDFIEDTLTVDGYLYRFIDTAGLREGGDTIERMGIDRSYQKIREARIILLLTEWSSPPSEIRTQYKEMQKMLDTGQQHLLPVINKCDTATTGDLEKLQEALADLPEPPLFISALKEENLETLKKRVGQIMHLRQPGDQEVIISNLRHYEALLHAAGDLQRVTTGLQEGLPADLVAMDLRQAIHHLGEITGEITTDEILGNIFAKFCIGK